MWVFLVAAFTLGLLVGLILESCLAQYQIRTTGIYKISKSKQIVGHIEIAIGDGSHWCKLTKD